MKAADKEEVLMIIEVGSFKEEVEAMVVEAKEEWGKDNPMESKELTLIDKLQEKEVKDWQE